jgi:hypothetical protein
MVLLLGLRRLGGTSAMVLLGLAVLGDLRHGSSSRPPPFGGTSAMVLAHPADVDRLRWFFLNLRMLEAEAQPGTCTFA